MNIAVRAKTLQLLSFVTAFENHHDPSEVNGTEPGRFFRDQSYTIFVRVILAFS